MTEDFERLIKQLGESTFSQIEAEMGGSAWTIGCLDARFDKAEGSWVGKIRAFKLDGTSESVGLSNEISLGLIYLKSQRGAGSGEWYGILVNVWPDHRCDIKLNYDPRCAADKSMFDS